MKRNPNPDLKKLARLLAELQATDNALEQLNARANARLQQITDKLGARLLTLGEAKAAVERELDALVHVHPEWFPAENRSKDTPHGTASARLTRAVVLDGVSEEEVMRRIVTVAGETSAADSPAAFRFDDLVKTTRELRREQLALLPADLLARLGLKVEEKDTFSFKPRKLRVKARPAALEPRKDLALAA